ncbi:MAG: sugar ABC transporter substrate-binding protein, partial [Firmicutes bacterium]|nr:sugar ABC transporter substrate-binding protein [Bacillota bacterium]
AGLGRHQGFMDVMARYPHIHVVAQADGDFSINGGFQAMSNILQAHPARSGPDAIDAIFAANDQSAVGAAKALKDAGRMVPPSSPEHVFIVGIDGGPTGIAALKAGEMDTIIGQHPITMAEEAVHYALAALHHRPSPGPVVYWPHVTITPQNVGSVQIWGKRMSTSGS